MASLGNNDLIFELDKASQSNPSVQVDRREVLQLIQQFLLENKLTSSLECLQHETRVLLPGTNPEKKKRFLRAVVMVVGRPFV